MTTTLLIDGDIIAYSCGFASDAGAKKDGLEYEPLEHCLHTVKKMLLSILENAVDADEECDYRVFLTGAGNFRDEVATTLPYKGNRDPTHKPHWLKEIRQYMVDKWDADVVDGMEADDAIGILAGPDTVVCSLDKDLDQIEGRHYNWRKGLRYDVTPAEAYRVLWMQMLTGDATDNIQGIKGVGPVKAGKILDSVDEEDYSLAVVKEYKKHFGDKWKERMEENFKLLYILRNLPNGEENKEEGTGTDSSV